MWVGRLESDSNALAAMFSSDPVTTILTLSSLSFNYRMYHQFPNRLFRRPSPLTRTTTGRPTQAIQLTRSPNLAGFITGPMITYM